MYLLSIIFSKTNELVSEKIKIFSSDMFANTELELGGFII